MTTNDKEKGEATPNTHTELINCTNSFHKTFSVVFNVKRTMRVNSTALTLLVTTFNYCRSSAFTTGATRAALAFTSTTAFPYNHSVNTQRKFSQQMSTKAVEEDPYLWLEEVESEESLNFAKDANAKCLEELGDPKTSGTGTYDKVLSVLESNDRIAYARKYGNDKNGEPIMFNLWKDSKNPKGLWRKTSLTSYKTEEPEWETVLDIDELAEKDGISWVWKGSTPLPRKIDPLSNGERVTRTLISLSRGGADATYLKEFDLLTESFVSEEDGGFTLPEAKTRASYKSRDVLYVGSDFGEGSLTDSGYPRVIKEWTRGTKIEDAPTVFEGEKTDVSVSAYMNDQRIRGGPIYEIRSRSLTFYTTKKYVRRVEYEHLLAADDPARNGIDDPEDFVQVDVQPDAGVSFVGKWIMISLRSVRQDCEYYLYMFILVLLRSYLRFSQDWQPVPDGKTYTSGSLLYTDADSFLTKGRESCEFKTVFEPSDTTAYDGYSFTKNYFILSIIDNVKSKLEFFKLDNEGFHFVGGDKEAKIRACDTGAIDSTESDDIWLYTSGYTQPSSLSIGDASLVEKKESSRDLDKDNESSESYFVENLKSLPSMYDSQNLEVHQKFATSEDGTKIPYFIIHKKDIKLDGKNPTLLYGYGGFEISLGPKYISTVGVSWLERGGVYVEANIRGGGKSISSFKLNSKLYDQPNL